MLLSMWWVEPFFFFPVEVGDEQESEESCEEEGEEEGTESDLVKPFITQPNPSKFRDSLYFSPLILNYPCPFFLQLSVCLRAQSLVWRRGWRRKRKQTARGSGHPGNEREGERPKVILTPTTTVESWTCWLVVHHEENEHSVNWKQWKDAFTAIHSRILYIWKEAKENGTWKLSSAIWHSSLCPYI